MFPFVPTGQTTSPTLDLRLRGKWWWRPLGNSKATWKVDCDTPAKADLDPAREYRLEVSASVTDLDLTHLAPLAGAANFRRLDLSGCNRLSAAGFARIALDRLEHLNCYGCAELGDAGLAYLGRLTGLLRLDLTRCKRVSDAGLAHLAGLPKLEHLDLSGCEWVTDAGLVHLAKVPTLKHLGLRNTQVTDAGAARLLRALPGLSVDR